MVQSNKGLAAASRTLRDLRPGESGIVGKLLGEGPMLQRLSEMGLTPGVTIKVLRVAPLGDPIEIRVRDYSLSLRKADAARVVLA